jgi:NAD(P)H dehydrogenase (quinone)
MTIALTGTSGKIGGKVLDRLVSGRVAAREPGSENTSEAGGLVLIGRDPNVLAPGYDRRAAVYGDTAGMTTALAGVDTLFFVSGRESATRLDEHLSVVDAAAAAGVSRIVYLSFLGNSPTCTFTFGRHHYFTEQRIRDAGLDFTFLQDSMYQDYLPFMADASGIIRGPAGEGRVSAVSTDDVADVAAAVVRAAQSGDFTHSGASYRVTGPAAMTFDEIADTLGAASGRKITYQRETESEAYASRASFGAPAFEVEGWVTSYQAVAAGELSAVSNDVETVTGHTPVSFAHFLSAHPETYEHLR